PSSQAFTPQAPAPETFGDDATEHGPHSFTPPEKEQTRHAMPPQYAGHREQALQAQHAGQAELTGLAGLGGQTEQAERAPRGRQAADYREQEAAPAHFPYQGDGPPPELRVEEDMRRLLEEAHTPLPTRDLGTLKDLPEGEEEADEDPMAEIYAGGIPWENPSRFGWLRGFLETVHGAMFRGPDFFAGFTGWGSLGPGYLFFLLMGYLTVLGSLAWTQIAVRFLPSVPIVLLQHISLPALLLMAPIALGLMLLFITGLLRLLLRLFAPDKAEFTRVFKVCAYSVAPFILSIVPFVGPVLGAVWFVVCLITGCRYALGLSWRQAAIIPLPSALLLIVGLGWFCI
ncbi:YIP1 family protein, partial [Desulfovibrio sp. OttesenSCG-928-A18]|nr:YIP1 family protein [Desulfovibrio sp. OttesenSCG-928-A18]